MSQKISSLQQILYENYQIILILLVYTFLIYAIAYLATRRTKKISDYILGGRNMSGFVTAMSAGASDMSSWLLMALPGSIYIGGLSQIWIAISLTLGAFSNWIIVSKRLRILSEKASDSLTIPAFLSNMFEGNKKTLRLITSSTLLIFFCFYAVAGFVSAGKLVDLSFNLGYKPSMIMSAVFIIAYTSLGGFLAVSWVDVFQGLLMFFALLIVPIVAYGNIGSVNFTAFINQINIENVKYLDLFSGTSVIGIISLFAWGMGYFGQPHIIGRFMAIKTEKELPLARNICSIWMLLSMLFAIGVGILGYVYYREAPLDDPEVVFLKLSKDLFNKWLNGILICAVLSSVMSTVSCLILMSSNALLEDILKVTFTKNNRIFNNLYIHRLSVILIALISVWMAYNPSLTIMQSVSFPWCGLGASFGPTIICLLYWKKTTYLGAISGIISGGGFVLGWEVLSRSNSSLVTHLDILPGFCLLPAVILSFTTIIIISSVIKSPRSILKKLI